jgi:hypothetical protein
MQQEELIETIPATAVCVSKHAIERYPVHESMLVAIDPLA